MAENISAQKTIDQEQFTITLPQGWSVMSDEENQAVVYKGESVKDFMNTPWMMVKACGDYDLTLDQYYEELLEEVEGRKTDDAVIGGETYKACIATERGEESYMLLGQQATGIVLFVICNATPDDAEVQAVVVGMKRK